MMNLRNLPALLHGIYQLPHQLIDLASPLLQNIMVCILIQKELFCMRMKRMWNLVNTHSQLHGIYQPFLLQQHGQQVMVFRAQSEIKYSLDQMEIGYISAPKAPITELTNLTCPK